MNEGLDLLSDLTIFSKYARFIPELNRRETWDEIVDRYELMLMKKYPQLKGEIAENGKYIRNKKVLPSMRALQFAGAAMEVNNARGFNCAYLPIDSIYSFSECMFLLLGGSGVGYSVRRHHINQLPAITVSTKKRKYLVQDSIIGWADAVKVLLKAYMEGKPLPDYDFRDIREKGTRLLTAGGKAPGPEPLKLCLIHIQAILDRKKDGEYLTSTEVHDIVCHIANSVLSGGIRRAALIALFDADDEEMLTCKFGAWWELNEQRGRANNTAVINRANLNRDEFTSLWKKVELSGSGEPGIYLTNNDDLGVNPCKPLDATILTPEGYITFKDALEKDSLEVIIPDGRTVKASKPFLTGINRKVFEISLSTGGKLLGTENHQHLTVNGWKRVDELNVGDELVSFKNQYIENILVQAIKFRSTEDVYDITVEADCHSFIDNGVITHNCNEASLQPYQFCNLCEINASDIANQEDYNNRARVAAFFGSLQAGFTDFHYLRPIWRHNTEADALLGVGMTGIASRAVESLDKTEAANVVVAENIRVTSIIGINPAARATLLKPAGTTSCVLKCSSGIHSWHDLFILRTVRFNLNEDIAKYLMENIPEICELDELRPHDTICVRIPIKAPVGSITRDETAIDLLSRVKTFYNEWVVPGHHYGDNTHNISATISIKPDEWKEVGEWMWNNKQHYNGLSVLPFDEHSYVQAPFQSITEQEYEERIKFVRRVDLTEVKEYDDNADFSAVASCAGGKCEVV